MDPMFIDLAKQAAKRIVARAVAQVAEPCSLEGCAKHSWGAVCGRCSRFSCQEHSFLEATIPPQVACIRCVAQEFRDFRKAAKEKAT